MAIDRSMTNLAIKYYHKLSNYNVMVISDSFSIENYEYYVHAVCKKCGEKQTITLSYLNSQAVNSSAETFCALHRHEGNKVDTDTVVAVSGKVIDGYGAEFKFGIQPESSDSNTDLVLAVAKASNFNVNVQGRANAFRTQYRLYCSVCHTDMDLGTRAITKAEIENPVTVTSKFCIEHAHRPNIKVPDAANYRKFREE